MKRGEARSKLTHSNGPQDPQQLGTATGAATDHLGVTGKWEGDWCFRLADSPSR